MSVSAIGPNVAYLCDGMGCAAVREEGKDCVIFEGEPCRHTFDPTHAVNGECENPAKYPERFEAWSSGDDRVYYFERVPGEENKESCDEQPAD